MPQSRLCPSIPDVQIAQAAGHVRAILEQAIELALDRAVVVVWDGAGELAVALAKAYQQVLPEATFLDFDRVAPSLILGAFDLLEPGDLVVLVQSDRFLLNAFRIRLELFARSIQVIEHPHLGRMVGSEAFVYLDSLAYDPVYFRGVGRALKARLDRASNGTIESGGATLCFPAGFEDAKLNVGDYSGMANTGGQYPIGEVFTESRDLEAVHGRVRIALFGDLDFTVQAPPVPITLVVEQGRVVEALDSTPEFDAVLASIRADEGQVWLRELGLGLNRAFRLDRRVCDVGAFERMCGVHLSLGGKHVVYNKAIIDKKVARQHVDVFVATEAVVLDGVNVFHSGQWVLPECSATLQH